MSADATTTVNSSNRKTTAKLRMKCAELRGRFILDIDCPAVRVEQAYKYIPCVSPEVSPMIAVSRFVSSSLQANVSSTTASATRFNPRAYLTSNPLENCLAERPAIDSMHIRDRQDANLAPPLTNTSPDNRHRHSPGHTPAAPLRTGRAVLCRPDLVDLVRRPVVSPGASLIRCLPQTY